MQADCSQITECAGLRLPAGFVTDDEQLVLAPLFLPCVDHTVYLEVSNQLT